MPTDSALEAVRILRDGSLFQWHLIPLFAYLHFFLISYWVHDMKTVRSKAITVAVIFGVDIAAAVLFGAVLGWI